MIIKLNYGHAITSTDVLSINNKEMRQMHELKNNIKEVLDSHKPNSKERKYISDDDLKMMHAILSVFTKDFSSTQESAFDNFLKEQDKPAEQPQEQEENETLIKGSPGRYPVDKPTVDECKEF